MRAAAGRDCPRCCSPVTLAGTSATAPGLGVSLLLKPIEIQEFFGAIRAHLRNAYGQKEASGQ
jgi:hypothetical protein